MMVKDIKGKTFGFLTALRHVGSNAQRQAMWLCRCICRHDACRHLVVVSGAMMRSGHTKSCGGHQRRRTAEASRGELHPEAKLNDNAVRFIRKGNGSQSDMAKAFGTHQSTVSRAKIKQTWRHVQ